MELTPWKLDHFKPSRRQKEVTYALATVTVAMTAEVVNQRNHGVREKRSTKVAN